MILLGTKAGHYPYDEIVYRKAQPRPSVPSLLRRWHCKTRDVDTVVDRCNARGRQMVIRHHRDAHSLCNHDERVKKRLQAPVQKEVPRLAELAGVPLARNQV